MFLKNQIQKNGKRLLNFKRTLESIVPFKEIEEVNQKLGLLATAYDVVHNKKLSRYKRITECTETILKFINSFESYEERRDFISDILGTKRKIPFSWLYKKTLIELITEKTAMCDEIEVVGAESYFRDLETKKSMYTYNLYTGKLGDLVVYWDGQVGRMDDLYVDNHHDTQEVYRFISNYLAKMFWEKNPQNITIQSKTGTINSGNVQETYFEEDKMDEIFPSEAADKLLQKAKSYIAKGINRSLLLYGPPGSGKTTTIKYICHHLNMTSIRIPIEYLENVGSNGILNILNLCNPDIVIIDDFDRTKNQVIYLDMFQYIRKMCKLVMLSANDITKMNDAILRPGRIDDIVEIEIIDIETKKRILAEFCDSAPQEIGDMPVAYIREYVDRARVLGQEEANESFIYLQQRFKKAQQDWSQKKLT